jgi:hypothetical protein
MGHLFEEAQIAHLEGHKQVAKGKQVLDFMWVYVYEFDKHGRRLHKCKAHLVKGDQRLAKSICENTYASTFAGRDCC